MNPHVFRQYDIRGKAEEDFPDAFVEQLGRALGSEAVAAGAERFALGRDCRLSSPRIAEAMARGLAACGLQVVDVGMVPTPLLYFAVHHLDLDGGVQVTGSHNPPDENGFKMMLGKEALWGEAIERLRRRIEAEDFAERPGGRRVERDVLPAYVGFVRGNVALQGPVPPFAVDAGNGAAGPAALAAMEALGLKPVALHCEPDGRFPNHHPDPTLPETLEGLRRTMREQGLRFGIAFDGDGDRIGVLDEHGEIVWGDRLLVLFARALLEERPGALVLGEVKCSQVMYDDIARHGGRPMMWKTGHSLIKARMKETGALLAGEMSGHLFFADRYYGFDDAIYASLRLIERLSERGASIGELLSDLPETFATPEIRRPCPDDRKFGVVEQVLEHFRRTHDVADVDGARIRFEGGWGLVRASNTQPVLVLRFEAERPERLDAIRAEVEAVVEQALGATNDPDGASKGVHEEN